MEKKHFPQTNCFVCALKQHLEEQQQFSITGSVFKLYIIKKNRTNKRVGLRGIKRLNTHEANTQAPRS